MKTILFICVQNSARSQMAEGLGRQLQGHRFEFLSAGSEPAKRVHPSAVAVMAEIGIDISKQKPKSLSDINLQRVDRIIALCEEEACPNVGKPVESWAMPDPVTRREDEQGLMRSFRKTRDAIRDKILKLSDDFRVN